MISEKKLLKLADVINHVVDAESVPLSGLLFDACQSYMEAASCECGQLRVDEEFCEDCADEHDEREDAEADAEEEA